MCYFGKLNIVSLLCSFILFVQLKIMGNVYRISRLSGLSLSVVIILSLIIEIALFLLSIVVYIISQKQFNWIKLRYILSILWIPYFIIYVLIYKQLFPITFPADNPPPVVGLLYIFILFVYPLFVAAINKIAEK